MACKCGLLIIEQLCHLESSNVYQQDEAFISGRTTMVKTVMQIQFKTQPQLNFRPSTLRTPQHSNSSSFIPQV